MQPDTILPCAAEARFRVGDRVTRPINVYKSKSPLRHGAVVRVYAKRSRFGFYAELYAVRWDDNGVERDFLPHGIDPEVTS
jgi:hypothetical protein